jgi:Raf kinase inhibitor-like YbhB/YbcL family protein
MKLSSNTIKEGSFLENEQILNGFGCTGENISPDLQWSDAPTGTKSYALIMHDPDAPIDGGWYHWTVINIPVTKTSFEKGEKIPDVMLGQTSFSKPGYGGACPPIGHGQHRYIFMVYALDVEEIPRELSSQEIEKHIAPHILAKASITTYYERK